MMNETVATDPIDDESEGLGDELDASDSDSGEDKARISVPSIPVP